MLRSHVGVRAERTDAAVGPLERPRDAEVDQAWRHPHDEVVGLDVEVNERAPPHEGERPGDVQGQGQKLLHLERTPAPEQSAQGGTLEVLDQNVRIGTAENGVEAPHDDRVGDPAQHLGLLTKLAQRPLVLGLVGTQHLRHPEREQVLVPDQVDLEARATAERFEDEPAIGDRGALVELPARPTHRG